MKRNTDNIGEYQIFGIRYQLPQIEGENPTKESILLNATVLFAKHGYTGVSMRDIAERIGIKSASLYHHFESKNVLWKAVLEHTSELYHLYFGQLDNVLKKAETFEEVIGLLLQEPKKLANSFTCYAFSMIQAEQIRDPEAAQVFTSTLLKYSIDFIGDWLDKCVERGLVESFDTKAVATVIMHSILVGLEVKVQEYLGRPTAYNPTQMFTDLERLILSLTKNAKSHQGGK